MQQTEIRKLDTDISLEEFDTMMSHISRHKNLYLFGTGKIGQVVASHLNAKNIQWNAFIDNQKAGQLTADGKRIISLNEIEDAQNAIILITVIYPFDISQIYTQLRQSGFGAEQIISMANTTTFAKLYKTLNNNTDLLERTRKYKDIHHGKRCFIIGNGPSLALEDLEKLRNDYTFACNQLYMLFPKTNWRPTYYMAADPVVIKQNNNIDMIINDCEAFITSIYENKMLSYQENEKIIYSISAYVFGNMHSEEDYMNFFMNRIQMDLVSHSFYSYFSENCSELVYGSGNVVYRMLQMAAYMGFHEIYLLGMDHDYSLGNENKNKANYCNLLSDGNLIIDGKANRNYWNDLWLNGTSGLDFITLGYISAKKYADEHGIHIYNATRGGKLEVFPRIHFDSLF